MEKSRRFYAIGYSKILCAIYIYRFTVFGSNKKYNNSFRQNGPRFLVNMLELKLKINWNNVHVKRVYKFVAKNKSKNNIEMCQKNLLNQLEGLKNGSRFPKGEKAKEIYLIEHDENGASIEQFEFI